jgi:hypothetical protein
VGKTAAFPRESQNSKSNAWDVDDDNRDENDVFTRFQTTCQGIAEVNLR